MTEKTYLQRRQFLKTLAASAGLMAVPGLLTACAPAL